MTSDEPPATPYAPVRRPDLRAARPRTTPAVQLDRLHDRDEPVRAVRVLYRVTLRIPKVLGTLPPSVPPAAAELAIVASGERLRARFEGPGWPVTAGAEVRLRTDLGGTYVFDEAGGRPLSPRFLAEWFEGGRVGARHRPAVGVRPSTEGGTPPGGLVCQFLTEWAGKDPSSLERRCGRHGAPIQFRVGPWFGERTAQLEVDVPASELRADHLDPPDSAAPVRHRAILAERQLARVEPSRGSAARRGSTPRHRGHTRARCGDRQPTPRARCGHGERGPARLGRLGHGRAHFTGLRPGTYAIAGMRPLGSLGWHPRDVRIPARLDLRRGR